MLKQGMELIECFKIHYCANLEPGTQPLENPFPVKNEKLSAFSRTGHTHSFYQYIYVLSSRGAKLHMDEGVCVLSPGCLYLINPGTHHDFRVDEDYELIMYEIKFSVRDEELEQTLKGLPHILPDGDGYVQKLVQELIAEYNNTSFRDDMPYVKLYELLLVLNRTAQAGTTPGIPGLKPYDPEYARFEPLFSYITRNFSRKLSVEQMANTMHMEKGYFSKLFKRQFDMTPMGYLQAVRITRAVNLIEYTELSVAEIADKVGFLNQNSFIKAFKGLYDMTPKEYRIKIRQKIHQKYMHPEIAEK